MAFVPIGINLASGTTESIDLPVDPDVEAIEISLGAGTALTSGETYAIVCTCPTATYVDIHTNNCPTWGQVIVDGYADGRRCANLEGDTEYDWQTYENRDCYFVTKATGVVKDSYTTNTHLLYFLNSDGKTWYLAQTFKASSDYTITSVVLALGKSKHATDPGTITVSIRNTIDVPTKATTPAPANTTTNITLDQATLTWVDGGGAVSYNVYFGTISEDLTLVSSEQEAVSFTMAEITEEESLSYITTYYWRIDSVNQAGTTTGDEWSFTTMRFSAPSQTYWNSEGGYYYRLLIDNDGEYGDHPVDGGGEGIDYEVLDGYLPNFISTTRKLVGIANSKVWVEDI